MSVWNILFLTSLINSCGAAYFLQGYPGDPGEPGKKTWRLKIPLKWNFYFIFTGVGNVVHIDIDCHLGPNVVSHGCPPWMSTLLPQTSDRSSANFSQCCQSCTLKFAGCSAYRKAQLGLPPLRVILGKGMQCCTWPNHFLLWWNTVDQSLPDASCVSLCGGQIPCVCASCGYVGVYGTLQSTDRCKKSELERQA